MLRLPSLQTLLLALALAILLAGCARDPAQQAPLASAPATPSTAVAPTIAPSDAAPTPATVSPTGTPTPLPTAAPTLSPTPSPAAHTAAAGRHSGCDQPSQRRLAGHHRRGGQPARRAGHGVRDYRPGQRGQRYPVLARSAAGDWWQIDMGGPAAWVSAGLVRFEGDRPRCRWSRGRASFCRCAPVQVYETTLSIPTYPYAAFTEEVTSTGVRLDLSPLQPERPTRPATLSRCHGRTRQSCWRTILLRITMLPDLGGRVYQVIFKPTGNNEMYENPVIKPSPWGPPSRAGGWRPAASSGACRWKNTATSGAIPGDTSPCPTTRPAPV